MTSRCRNAFLQVRKRQAHLPEIGQGSGLRNRFLELITVETKSLVDLLFAALAAVGV